MSRAGYDRKRVHNGCTSSLEIRGGFREGKRKGYPVSSSRLSLSPQDRATVLPPPLHDSLEFFLRARRHEG